MFFVRGTAQQLKDIDELIARADIPPFQVVIKALVYTANEDKLKDVGVRASAIFGTGNLNSLGGITSQPGALPVPVTPVTPGQVTVTPVTPGQLNPGGVRTLGLRVFAAEWIG